MEFLTVLPQPIMLRILSLSGSQKTIGKNSFLGSECIEATFRIRCLSADLRIKESKWHLWRKNIVQCTENSKYIFPEMKLRGLVPNFYVHVSVSDIYIPMIGTPQTDPGNIYIAHRYMNVEVGRQNIIILFWK